MILLKVENHLSGVMVKGLILDLFPASSKQRLWNVYLMFLHQQKSIK